MADVRARLRPGLPLLWRSLTEVQVGTDPRWAVVLADLTPAAARALQRIGTAPERRDLLDALTAQHVTVEEATAVAAHLRSVGLAVDGPARVADGPDRAAWCLLEPDGDGDALVAARERRRVRVTGLDRVGVAVAGLLAGAGVGTVEPADDRVVTVDDVGAAGLCPDDVGSRRSDAVGRLVRRLAPDVRTAGGRASCDVEVVVEHGAADPVRYQALAADGRTHLSVVVREASVLVGPLVVPGRTPCLRCADLARAEHDERWPAVASQLVGRQVRTGLETTLVAAASALAAAQVLAHLDGRPAATSGGSLEVRLPDLLPRSTTWPLHPRCGCSGLDVA